VVPATGFGIQNGVEPRQGATEGLRPLNGESSNQWITPPFKSVAPAGAVVMGMRPVRWLASPANFRNASGVLLP
jgi:hypothetical protein